MPRPGPVPGFSLAGLIRIARIRLLSAYSSGDDKKPDLVGRAICLISLVGRVRLELTTNGLKVLKSMRFFMLNGIHENVENVGKTAVLRRLLLLCVERDCYNLPTVCLLEFFW